MEFFFKKIFNEFKYFVVILGLFKFFRKRKNLKK